ncbi:MAG: DUF2182 domain-containing protein [Actinobacteria bacterium]|nr:DUF2182 domain-containing protein [Actinomycetota bacterium]
MGRHHGAVRAVRAASFLGGYLVSWAAFGVAAYAAVSWAGRLAGHGAARWAGAGVYAAAGLYQLTPVKQACLRSCRSPFGYVMARSAAAGRLRDLRTGIHHGLTCVSCCWALMGVLVAVGVMNLGAMAVLATVVLLEKTWRGGPGLARGLGLVLLFLAVLAPFHPGLLPGLRPAMMSGT